MYNIAFISLIYFMRTRGRGADWDAAPFGYDKDRSVILGVTY